MHHLAADRHLFLLPDGIKRVDLLFYFSRRLPILQRKNPMNRSLDIEPRMVDYFALIQQIIDPTSLAYRIYIPHVVLVTHKALAIARRCDIQAEELRFIEEGAMLHDIGMIAVFAPEIGCSGKLPYLCHGIEGRRLLEQAGLPMHALVCERHLGVGLTREEIRTRQMPLPDREMVPQTRAEEIICLADLFFSKTPDKLWREKSLAKIRKTVDGYGQRQRQVLETWIGKYHLEEKRGKKSSKW